ncbi:scavenger receptor class A member 5-like isoform X3 [Xenopus laevis]|uniref:Scavenger receptor class A member 5-like isoform X3 n=1 Tax=Xenopus laevis TaxID=8355 RepID=A0A8J1KP56_XENLA|nr:scavenger receptor class A member 5-like isoform X3 [Xenopus laevis]
MCACSGVLQRGTAHDPGRESQWEDRHAGKNASPTLHYQRKRINRAATRKHTETKRITRMDNKAMYLHSFDEKENGSAFEEPYDGRNLSKMNLCDGCPTGKRRSSRRCGQLGSIAALKYAVVGLYLLVFLILSEYLFLQET